MMHRDEIEKFCRNFLRGNSHRQLHELIGNFEHVSSQIDIQQFTQDTLDCLCHRICSEVFTHTHTHAMDTLLQLVPSYCITLAVAE